MTQPGAQAVQDIMKKATCLLLDFDGPICDIFAGLPASEVAARLRAMLQDAGAALPSHLEDVNDPLEIFRFSATLGDGLNLRTLQELTTLEVTASATARPTPGAVELLDQARKQGKRVAVVSNNSGAAVAAYLELHGLTGLIDDVSARSDADPALMKPNPHLLNMALSRLGAEPAHSLLVGDSLTDMEASKRAGVVAVGYANRPGKVAGLADAGADLVVTSMQELVLT